MKTRQTSSSGIAARPAGRPAVQPGIKARGKTQVPSAGNSATAIAPEEVRQMIENAAYFRAEQRGFAAGHELEDWLEAEAEVRRQLGGSVS